METKTYPKGTTKEQWDRYEQDLIEWESRYEARRPKAERFPNYDAWNTQLTKWHQDKYMSRPNEPGYYRAAND